MPPARSCFQQTQFTPAAATPSTCRRSNSHKILTYQGTRTYPRPRVPRTFDHILRLSLENKRSEKENFEWLTLQFGRGVPHIQL